MITVIKRDGSKVPFHLDKIKEAIQKAFDSVSKTYDDSILDLLSVRVTAEFQPSISNGMIQVEDIQDSVERVLSISGYADVAKAYILYRKQRENLRRINNTALDYKKIVDAYLNNTNNDTDDSLSLYSVGGFILSNSATITRNYWLSIVFDQQIAQAHEQGDIYIHDLGMMTGDSAGWSLQQLIREGLGGIDKKISCRPARHLSSICSQLVNFLGIMQNEWAGAQSIPSFDTYLAPFIKHDNMTQEEVDQCIESFIYGVNMPSRWGTQSPFSTVGFDWVVPEDLKNQNAWVGNEKQTYTYGDCQEEMRMIQHAFFKTLNTPDLSGHGFPYPIPTVNIHDDFDWNDDIAQEVFRCASQYGSPYFRNAKLDQTSTRDSEFSRDTLPLKSGGYFGYGENTGSLGMVTLNVPRLAFVSKTEDEFFQSLSKLLELSVRALNVKRKVLQTFFEEGLYPYTKRYIHSFDNYCSTIGIIGMNEVTQLATWIQEDLSSARAQSFAQKTQDYIKERLIAFQNEYGYLFNLEATPGEKVSYHFIQLDKQAYPDFPLMKKEYYTNSTDLPVNYTNDIFEALEIEQLFLSKYTGGSVFHVYTTNPIQKASQCQKLVKTIIEHYRVPNFTISPSYSICPEHGYINGVHQTCPKCGKPTEIWARIAGYYQPIQNWNKGKMQEFLERENYVV